MYKIKPFLIYKAQDEMIVQTNESTTIIKDNKLMSFLEEIELQEDDNIVTEHLKHYWNENDQSNVISFLLNNKICYEVNNPKIFYHKVTLITNNKEFLNSFKYCLESFFDNITTIFINETNVNISNEEMDMCFIMLNPFSLTLYEKINKNIIEKNSIIKNIFVYNHSIYISNFYKKEWKNPCPMCFFSNLEAQLRGETVGGNGVSFQTLIDIIYDKHSRFLIEYNINNHEYIPIFNHIMHQMKNKKFDYVIDEVVEICIATHEIATDFAYYWEFCDCYE